MGATSGRRIWREARIARASVSRFPGFLGGTPRQCITAAFAFFSNEPSERVDAAADFASSSSLARVFGRSLLQLAAAVRYAAVRRRAGPRSRAPAQRRAAAGISAAGRPVIDHDARAALSLDARQQLAHTGPRLRLEAIDTERRQRSVIIQQQKRFCSAREGREEFVELSLVSRPSTLTLFHADFSAAISCTSNGRWRQSACVGRLSRRNSRRSPSTFAAHM